MANARSYHYPGARAPSLPRRAISLIVLVVILSVDGLGDGLDGKIGQHEMNHQGSGRS